MSRALFVSLCEDRVIAECQTAKVGISTIEKLPTRGVRLVCMSSDGAAKMKRKLKTHLIADTSRREPHRPRTPLW